MINPNHKRLAIVRQCFLAGISRSSFVNQGKGESALNLKLMRMIDGQRLKTPFFGSPRTAGHLRREGHKVSRKRVRRLMRKKGLEAVYTRPRTTKPHPGPPVYPYLLTGMTFLGHRFPDEEYFVNISREAYTC